MDWKWKVPYKGGGQHFGCGNSNGIKSDFSKPAFSLLRRRTQIGPLKFCEATPAPGGHELCEEARRIE